MVCIAIPSVIFLILAVQPEFWKLVFPREDLEVSWVVNPDYQKLWVIIDNEGFKQANVSRVELIYLPNETLGLIWTGRWLVPRETTPWLDWEAEGERLDFFNLLVEGRDEAIVRIEVETTEAIYIFYPQGHQQTTQPTTIERK